MWTGWVVEEVAIGVKTKTGTLPGMSATKFRYKVLGATTAENGHLMLSPPLIELGMLEWPFW